MPSSPTADRNLLFGLLALQMDFIGRDALVQAMNAWVVDKARPLGQILVEQGSLPSDVHPLLEALLQKHVEMHGGDPEKSLRSVSCLGLVRDGLRQIADPDLHATLAVVPATSPPNQTRGCDSPSSGQSSADSDSGGPRAPLRETTSSTRLRFHIIRPHAQGGLGKVFVARDAELGREVALKEIQDQHADDLDSRSRFVREAEITGGLEHPGIVPVYGLGQYADGRPFYAMRFIRGESLQDAIRRFHEAGKANRDPREATLELRRLLGRFVTVCNAIAYAHSRGVLHRDLKPDNIMLGQYGETLVVDWGLAKVIGRSEGVHGSEQAPLQPESMRGSAPTQMGSALGTPPYMSPEQAAGRLDQLGPPSDIYSLGAVLYCLLTGRPPFDGADLAAILRQVRDGAFLEPRVVNPSVPPELELICMKAMARTPEDRYPSALALADAIERWLADEPLSGYRDQVFTISADGRFTSLVPAFEARYGWSRAEWLGKPFAPMVHPDDLPLCMSMFQRALQGETPPVFSLRMLTKSGQHVTDEITCILQVLEGKVVGVLGLARAL